LFGSNWEYPWKIGIKCYKKENEVGKLVPLDVKKGDKILFGKWSGTEVKMNSEDYLIMKESDIMGIITSTKKKKK
jgi:chaperonin GroES